MAKGTIYILLNPKFPDLIKIGKTTRDPNYRIKELSRQTGVPADFILIYDEVVDDCDRIEREIHQKFAGYRECRQKEFFRVRPTDAIKALQELSRNFRVDLSDASPSRNMLSELKIKYPNYIKKDITSIRIIHFETLCLLEIIRKPCPNYGDHIIERIDLDIFYETPFVTSRSPNENADSFINELDAYSLLMTTTIFNEESYGDITLEYENQSE